MSWWAHFHTIFEIYVVHIFNGVDLECLKSSLAIYIVAHFVRKLFFSLSNVEMHHHWISSCHRWFIKTLILMVELMARTRTTQSRSNASHLNHRHSRQVGNETSFQSKYDEFPLTSKRQKKRINQNILMTSRWHYSPWNFVARVERVDDIFWIASRVFFSITCREDCAAFISICVVQHDPPDGTSQYRRLSAKNK